MTSIMASGYLVTRYTGQLGNPNNSAEEQMRDTLAGPHGPPYAVVARKDLIRERNGWYKIPAENVLFVASDECVKQTHADLSYIRKAGFFVPSDEKLSQMIFTELQMMSYTPAKAVSDKAPEAQKEGMFAQLKSRFKELTTPKKVIAAVEHSLPAGKEIRMVEEDDDWVLPDVVSVSSAHLTIGSKEREAILHRPDLVAKIQKGIRGEPVETEAKDKARLDEGEHATMQLQ